VRPRRRRAPQDLTFYLEHRRREHFDNRAHLSLRERLFWQVVQKCHKGLPILRTGPPADFDGPGDAWSPGQWLPAAAESSFLFKFQAISRASKLAFTSRHLSGGGLVDRKDSVTASAELFCGLYSGWGPPMIATERCGS